MRELDLINEILHEYEAYSESAHDLALSEVRMAMTQVLITLRGLDAHVFQISKNTFITLSKAMHAESDGQIGLSTEEKQQFKALNLAFHNPEFVANLRRLRQQFLNNQTARDVIIRIHHVFSGECIMLAAKNKTAAENTVLIFSSQQVSGIPNNMNEAAVSFAQFLESKRQAETKAVEANDIYRRVGGLCERYRL